MSGFNVDGEVRVDYEILLIDSCPDYLGSCTVTHTNESNPMYTAPPSLERRPQ